ncbi:hypothetical protein OAO50_09130, partial [Paracoccaceae bacterium]|nr:hypothetical protein [Paracoccaceae bacterium]
PKPKLWRTMQSMHRFQQNLSGAVAGTAPNHILRLTRWKKIHTQYPLNKAHDLHQIIIHKATFNG